MSNTQDKIQISTRRLDYKGSIQFFQQVDKAFKEGYEIVFSDMIKDSPRLGGYPRVFMQKVATSSLQAPVEAPVDTPDELSIETLDDVSDEEDNSTEGAIEAPELSFEDMTKKADLLAYADSNGIEVPENLKQPAAIKKYLQELQQ